MHSRVKPAWAPNQHTDGPHVIHVGTFGSHDPPEAFFLRRAVGFVQVSLPVAVHHTPLAVQHPETVPAEWMVFQKAAWAGEQASWPSAGPQGSPAYSCSEQLRAKPLSLSSGDSGHLPGNGHRMPLGHLEMREDQVLPE